MTDWLERCVAAIDEDRVRELALDICRISHPDGLEEPTAEFIADYLGRAGVDIELDYVLPGRPNVVARIPGAAEGPGLLLNAHLDFVPAAGWSRDPYAPWLSGGRVYGAGIGDMRAGLVAMVVAIEAAATRIPPPGPMVLLASMYHDTVGLGVKYAMASSDDWPDFAVCGEPSNMAIHTAHGGALKIRVDFSGETAHVSRLADGADALKSAIRAASALEDLDVHHTPNSRLESLPLILVGELRGGYSPSLVADRATLTADVRTVPGVTRRSLRKQIEGLAQEAVLPGVRFRVLFTAEQRPFLGAERGGIVDALSSALEGVTGKEAFVTSALPGQAFVTDAADLAKAGIDATVFGPGEYRQIPDDSVALSDIVDAARTYLALAFNLQSVPDRPSSDRSKIATHG